MAGNKAALNGHPSQDSALAAPLPQADSHSPLSEESAGTRRAFSPRAAERRLPSLDAASQEEEEEEEEEKPQQKGNVKPGGPCFVCWTSGECLDAACHVFLVWSYSKFGS